MKISDRTVVSAPLPTSWRWEFGGHLYGLEPLVLDTGLPRCSSEEREVLTREFYRCALRTSALADTDVDDLSPEDPFEIDRVFWFRWITGHQATFALWQMIASLLDEAGGSRRNQDRLIERIRRLIRGYSLLLLYASSAPREIYERVIRLPMARQHPNLSGSWAPDYQPIRPLIAGKLDFGDSPHGAFLTEECLLNERIHQAIAERLIPSATSLLQSQNPRPGCRRLARKTLIWLYDGIFLTSRASITYETFARQLIRRANAILLDLRSNGLYPEFSANPAEDPPALHADDIEALSDSYQDVLGDMMELAGLSLTE